MSILADRQKDDLHKAILDYLHSAGYTKAYEQFKEELPNLAAFTPEPNAKNTGILVKKWTSIMELETRLNQALEENAMLGNMSAGSSKRANPDWIPSAPAKHTLLGHRGPIMAVTFHPIYTTLVTASDDATLKVWEWESGELEKTLKGHTKSVTDCDFDSKGKTLVSSSYDLLIKLWNVDNDYQNFATLRGHEHSISSAKFMPGDARIVSSSRDLTVRIWDIASTHCIKVIHSHDQWIRTAQPSFDGRWILTCSVDHTARILDAESGNTKATMIGHDHVLECAVFVPRNAVAAVRALITPESESEESKARMAKIDSLGVSFVVTGSRDRDIKIWDALHGQCVYTLKGHNDWIRSLVFHPSGKYLLSSSDDYSFRVWELKTGKCVRTIPAAHTHFVACMAWGRQRISGPDTGTNGAAEGADGEGERIVNVLATGSSDKEVKVWIP
ncbi:dynein regulator [Sistotremastrum niveocremeum HHB9708]|uniref:Nuclear distribution protein PAC1 n=1 Tax=Sistotremastrum niveocremeum HHB9708 TaxID=1314777 RepID=A0A164QI85_9AGAM|nr:dynein regulator [Sistotremastrum niveocremeum HHB9708]